MSEAVVDLSLVLLQDDVTRELRLCRLRKPVYHHLGLEQIICIIHTQYTHYQFVCHKIASLIYS